MSLSSTGSFESAHAEPVSFGELLRVHGLPQLMRRPMQELSRSPRFSALADWYLEQLSSILSSRLAGRCVLTQLRGEVKSCDAASLFCPSVAVHLRVFQGRCAVIISKSLVQQLVRQVINVDVSAGELDSRALSAVALFLLKAIADEPLFARQRIYVTSIRPLICREEAEDYLQRIRQGAENGSLGVMDLQLERSAVATSVLFLFDQHLFRRLVSYRQFAAPHRTFFGCLQRAKSCWKVILLVDPALLPVLYLDGGKRLMQVRLSRARLVQMTMDQKRKRPLFPRRCAIETEILPGGRLGLLQLCRAPHQAKNRDAQS